MMAARLQLLRWPLWGAAIVAALWSTTEAGRSLAALNAARADHAALEALTAQVPATPAPLALTGAAIAAREHGAAINLLREHLKLPAARRGVLVERASSLPADPERPSLLRIRLTASGQDQALLRYVDEIERGQPLVRFTDWRIDRRQGDPALRLQATAVALWARR